jgi:hypothetical protein
MLVILCCLGSTPASAGDGFALASSNRQTYSMNHQAQNFVLVQPENTAGRVTTLGVAGNDMATYLDPAYYDWLNQHFDALIVYPPWFQPHAAHVDGYKNGYIYKDLYAIYDCRLSRYPADDPVEPDSPDSICAGANQPNLLGLYEAAMQAEADPEAASWILKDTDGNPLYIPFTDGADRYTQLAANIQNPAFRQFWIGQMLSVLTSPDEYQGIFIDDVNIDLEKSISNGVCKLNAVPTTKDCDWSPSISPADWANSLVTFVEAIRNAFPEYEIIHNSVWYHSSAGTAAINAQIMAADIINVERGFHDQGLTPALLPALFDYHEKVHGFGRRISHYIHVHGKEARGVLGQSRELEHGLAGWLLISNGNDLFGGDHLVYPDARWEGYDIDLGAAAGAYYQTADNLYRRDFTRGMVLLSPPAATPAAAAQQVPLPGYFRTLNGECLDEITLPPGRGRVLFSTNSCTGPGNDFTVPLQQSEKIFSPTGIDSTDLIDIGAR